MVGVLGLREVPEQVRHRLGVPQCGPVIMIVTIYMYIYIYITYIYIYINNSNSNNNSSNTSSNNNSNSSTRRPRLRKAALKFKEVDAGVEKSFGEFSTKGEELSGARASRRAKAVGACTSGLGKKETASTIL